MSIDDSDIYHYYVGLWKTQYRSSKYGIQILGEPTMLKHRVGAGAYANRFCIPLDFVLLKTHTLFFQARLGDRLEYELTFNDYLKAIKATDPESCYSIKNICLEFDKVSDSELVRQIRQQYSGRTAVLFYFILFISFYLFIFFIYFFFLCVWNINLNILARSMKWVLMLFEDPNLFFFLFLKYIKNGEDKSQPQRILERPFGNQ